MDQLKQDSIPDVIRIEPSGKCNFRCMHCPTGIHQNSREILKEDKFSSIIRQFNDKRFVPRVVVLYHGGEPLLNDNLSSYIQTLKKIGVVKVHIVTNGKLLTEKISEKLIVAGIDEIHVSFDGTSADENNLIRVNGDFFKDALNVKKFYKLYKKIGFKKVRILISNVQLINKFYLQHERVIIPEYLTEYFCKDCPEIEFQSVPAMVWPGFVVRDEYYIDVLPKKSPNYCGSLFETMTILANGDVVPCCYDLLGEVVFGNVFENNFFDIWNCQKYMEFRANFRRRIYSELCSRCILVSPRYLCKNENDQKFPSTTRELKKKGRFSEEQIVGILREADRSPVAQVAKKHGISEQTIYTWRQRFAGMSAT